MGASVYDYRGQPSRFLEVNSRGLAIARRYQLGFFTALAEIHEAFTLARVHCDASQIPVAEELLAELGADGTLVGAPHFILKIGQAQLACGQATAAAASAELAAAVSVGTNQRFRDAAIKALSLKAAHQLGALDDDWRREASETLAFSVERGLASSRIELASTIAELSEGTPELAGALRDLRDAIEAIAEPGGVPLVEESELLYTTLAQTMTSEMP